MLLAIDGRVEADVPCGSCTACCRSAQFVAIGPDETATLAAIPKALQFPAPNRPPGHVLLPYDEHGCCPMLTDDGCSIYEQRPRACRTYDCRVLAAASRAPDDVARGTGADGRRAPAARVRRWRFDHPGIDDRVQHDAVRAAAQFLDAHRDVLPDGAVPVTATHLAVVAVEIADAFVAPDGNRVVEPALIDVVEALTLTGR